MQSIHLSLYDFYLKKIALERAVAASVFFPKICFPPSKLNSELTGKDTSLAKTYSDGEANPVTLQDTS